MLMSTAQFKSASARNPFYNQAEGATDLKYGGVLRSVFLELLSFPKGIDQGLLKCLAGLRRT